MREGEDASQEEEEKGEKGDRRKALLNSYTNGLGKPISILIATCCGRVGKGVQLAVLFNSDYPECSANLW